MSETNAAIGIGELARRAGCKPETVRYYERVGLMSGAMRTEGGQRRYGEEAVRRLTFIRHARDFGFSVDAVRELLTMSDRPDMSCHEVDVIAKHHLEEVESRLQRLEALRDELRRMVGQCAGGKVESCRIIEVLSDHQLCNSEQAHGGAGDLKQGPHS
ncbi:helix-turn-helix domain-containing protein [Halomonas sp. KAO]|uniref:MerR family transcriptional regulator n=1 Tax=unclassified Halomonas TaxID=2609666 RepID=UPI00189DF1DB|nr:MULTISPECIES: helix-turn-helix domain-containing protein [unclassified Halomonas]MBF7054969.1 helix-turn-helix domain-containing protein [Halomonas sp. KAO]MDT0501443.1 helix-turn-helix domain-containing protein [Halomonas sp. PAR7]MDT0512883.1 helix-turn-helix domain-containing protein [Halomonas sp. LES1]MDT0591292.1 helix-turn-helix domain-containing protein [Halomonas sp. PAR8]